MCTTCSLYFWEQACVQHFRKHQSSARCPWFPSCLAMYYNCVRWEFPGVLQPPFADLYFVFCFILLCLAVFFPQILMSARRVPASSAPSAASTSLAATSVPVLSRATPWQPTAGPAEVTAPGGWGINTLRTSSAIAVAQLSLRVLCQSLFKRQSLTKLPDVGICKVSFSVLEESAVATQLLAWANWAHGAHFVLQTEALDYSCELCVHLGIALSAQGF